MNDRFLLINVGNTHTRMARATKSRVGDVLSLKTAEIYTRKWPKLRVSGALISSVVPKAVPILRAWLRKNGIEPLILSPKLDLGIGIRYPNPQQIGADRLANAVGVSELYGAPAVVVDFGTALTFDIVNKNREYVGGVIAPGLDALTDYLHERTALLPKIEIAEPRSFIGKSTVSAMQIGAVIGYRGLVREILNGILRSLNGKNPRKRAVVVATGGNAELIARKIPEIARVNPTLTLEGLRFIYLRNRK
jgi:type III pantothenate kinase